MLNLTKLDKTEITTEGITHRWIQMAGNFTKAHRCVGSDSALQTVGLKVKHDIPFSYVENCRFFFFTLHLSCACAFYTGGLLQSKYLNSTTGYHLFYLVLPLVFTRRGFDNKK